MWKKMWKTEFWIALAGGIAAVSTALIETGVLAPIPQAAAIVSVAAIVSTYVAGRSWVKGKHAQAAGEAIRRSSPTPPPKPTMYYEETTPGTEL